MIWKLIDDFAVRVTGVVLGLFMVIATIWILFSEPLPGSGDPKSYAVGVDDDFRGMME